PRWVCPGSGRLPFVEPVTSRELISWYALPRACSQRRRLPPRHDEFASASPCVRRTGGGSGCPPSRFRSDPRCQRSRRVGVLPGPARVTRGSRSLRRITERAGGHLPIVVARTADGILAQRLQRIRPADGRRSLP